MNIVMFVFYVSFDENTGLNEILKHGTHEVKNYHRHEINLNS